MAREQHFLCPCYLIFEVKEDCLGWYFRKGQLVFTLCRFGRGPLHKYPSLHYQELFQVKDLIMHLLYLHFYIYKRLKQLLSLSAQSNAHPSTIQTLLCGGLVGSTAALFTTPFDVVKTRLQTETSLKWIMAMQIHDIACCSFYHKQVSILEQMNMPSSLAIWNASYWGLHLYSRGDLGC